MAVQKFLIGPPQSGLERDVKSWLIADDAYDTLKNAYVWRGSLRKRFGSQLLVDGDQTASRLRVNLGGQTGANTWDYTVTAADADQGQMFSLGSTTYYVPTTGAPVQLITSSSPSTKTFDTTTGQVIITDTAPGSVDLYWYPSLPVMGLITYNTTNINDEFPIAFDTRYAYKRESSAWEQLALGTNTWTGDNKDFFLGANYRADTADQNILFVTNFVEADGIRFYNDEAITVNAVAVAAGTWTKASFAYASGGNSAIKTAKLIFYFKDRLVLLNVKEQVSGTTKHFPNRCRYSQNGSPFESDAWYQAPAVYGKGGFIDAPTEQAIVTAQFLKDRLIVFFERSTYELVYTGNKVLPFVWQKINTELGAESTFSQVPFDEVVLGVGNVGIHACDGASVQRIDDKIPQEVFRVRNENSGLERVAGVRDYQQEMVYWTFPDLKFDGSISSTYPNRVLVYNYKNRTWSFNDDSITSFGYWQRGTNAESPRWENIDDTWQELDMSWGIGSQQLKERLVLAGNQQGFTFYVNNNIDTNSESLQISNFDSATNLMTVYNHNLTSNDTSIMNSVVYVYISQTTGVTDDSDGLTINGRIYPITVVSDSTFTLDGTTFSGTYTGGGLISRVSKIEAFTKDFNFFIKDTRNMAINRIQFYVDVTASGEIMVGPVIADSNINVSQDANGSALNPILGTSVLETKRITTEPFYNKERTWRSVFLNAEGESIQLRLYFSDSQMKDPSISRVGFQLNSFIIYAQPTADR